MEVNPQAKKIMKVEIDDKIKKMQNNLSQPKLT